jgi:hypothetical protein
MSPRGIGAIALMVPGIFLERALFTSQQTFAAQISSGYYGYGYETWIDDPRRPFAIAAWVAALASVGGGVIALRLGPRLTAAIGAFVSLVGGLAFVLRLDPILHSPNVTAFILAVGGGLAIPAVLATAADIVLAESQTPSRFSATAGIATLFYAIMTGAVAAGSTLATRFGPYGAGVWLGIAGSLFAALFFAGATVLGGGLPKRDVAAPAAGPYRSAEVAPRPPAVIDPRPFAGLAVLLAASLPLVLGARIGLFERDLFMSGRFDAVGAAAGAAIVAFFALAVWVSRSVDRAPRAPLGVAAAGLVLAGLALPLRVVDQHGDGWVFASAVFVGAGRTLAMPVLYAYVALAFPRRWATLAIGCWVFVTAIATRMVPFFPFGTPLRTGLIVAFGAIALGVGIGVWIFAQKIHVTYFDPPSA